MPPPAGAIEAILSRRSVRTGFTDEAVHPDDLEVILRCGLAAPSSKGAAPWRFHLVTDRRLLQAIADAGRGAPGIDDYVPHDPVTGQPRRDYRSTVVESCDVLADAPVGIFIENRGTFSNGRRVLAGAELDRRMAALMGFGLEMMGIGGAIENMWVAATALGLGAVLMGDVVIAEDAIRELLAVGGDIVGVLAIGHPVEVEHPYPKAAHPSDLVVHYPDPGAPR